MPISGYAPEVESSTVAIDIGGRIKEVPRTAPLGETVARLIGEAGWKYGVLVVDGVEHDDLPDSPNFCGMREVSIRQYVKNG